MSALFSVSTDIAGGAVDVSSNSSRAGVGGCASDLEAARSLVLGSEVFLAANLNLSVVVFVVVGRGTSTRVLGVQSFDSLLLTRRSAAVVSSSRLFNGLFWFGFRSRRSFGLGVAVVRGASAAGHVVSGVPVVSRGSSASASVGNRIHKVVRVADRVREDVASAFFAFEVEGHILSCVTLNLEVSPRVSTVPGHSNSDVVASSRKVFIDSVSSSSLKNLPVVSN